jgi:hypothetical protein
MDTDKAELNAYHYGSNWHACPHCGKLYKVYRPETIAIKPVDYVASKEDDWGNPIVSDYDYYTGLTGEDSKDSIKH